MRRSRAGGLSPFAMLRVPVPAPHIERFRLPICATTNASFSDASSDRFSCFRTREIRNAQDDLGYIDVAFGVRTVGQNIYTGIININGGQFTQGAEADWDVAPFTFGQAFNYTVDLGVIGGRFDYYLSELTFEGARVFTEMPTDCHSVSGLCDSPSYTDISKRTRSPSEKYFT
jgi:hypothetical protein